MEGLSRSRRWCRPRYTPSHKHFIGRSFPYDHFFETAPFHGRAGACPLAASGFCWRVQQYSRHHQDRGGAAVERAAGCLGQDLLNGVNLAVSELNKNNFSIDGKRVTLEVVAVDDRADSATGKTVAQQLVDARGGGGDRAPQFGREH